MDAEKSARVATPASDPKKSNGTTYASKLRSPASQICAVMVKNAVLLAYGMTAGLPTILIPRLSSPDSGETIHLDQEGISWIGSIGTMCLPLGCLLSGVIVTRIGLKRNMQVVCIPFMLCCLGFVFVSTIWHIYLALGVMGFAAGLLEAPVVGYVAEITEPHLRGVLTATGGLAVHLGLLIEFGIGSALEWRHVALITSIAPLICFLLLFVVPESPQWLITQERHADARRNLAWLRGWVTIAEIEPEFQEILEGRRRVKQDDKGDREKSSALQKYMKRNFVVPLVMLWFMLFLTHFNGATPLQTYAVTIFKVLQSPVEEFQSTIIFGAAELLGFCPCIILIHYIGKRVLLFSSLILGSACMITVGTFAHLVDIKYFEEEHEGSIDNRWLPLTFLVAAGFVFQCTRMTPWILMGEVFPRESNAVGTAVAGAVSFVFGFFANKVFLNSVQSLTLPGTFWLFGALGVLGLVVLYFWLPETEGKSLQEITDHFSGVSKLDNKVRRGGNKCDNTAL